MYHFLYKTTNLLNGKYYIGKHSTRDISDGYLGSGIHLRSAIAKYGKDYFEREIISFYPTVAELNIAERNIVTENLISDPNCYNIAYGGIGGNLGEQVNELIRIRTSLALTGKTKTLQHRNAIAKSKAGFKHTDASKNKIRSTQLLRFSKLTLVEKQEKFGHIGKSNGFYNKRHSIESIEKMRASIGDSRKGSLNPNARKVVVNGIEYSTMKEARNTLGLTRSQLLKKIGEL